MTWPRSRSSSAMASKLNIYHKANQLSLTSLQSTGFWTTRSADPKYCHTLPNCSDCKLPVTDAILLPSKVMFKYSGFTAHFTSELDKQQAVFENKIKWKINHASEQSRCKGKLNTVTSRLFLECSSRFLVSIIPVISSYFCVHFVVKGHSSSNSKHALHLMLQLSQLCVSK